MPTWQENLAIFGVDTQTHTHTHILSFRLAEVRLSTLKYQILSRITRYYILSVTLMLDLIKEKCRKLGFHYILLCYIYYMYFSFPGGSDGKESACNAGDLGSIPVSGRSPGEGKWQPTPLFLPGELHGQRSFAGYSSWGHKESYMTHWLILLLPHIFWIRKLSSIDFKYVSSLLHILTLEEYSMKQHIFYSDLF